MKKRAFGKAGWPVGEIGFGAWQIGGGWGEQDDAQAIEVLRAAHGRGVDFFDTALAYGEGHSERLIGRALGDVRQKIRIASKIPPKNRRWPATDDDPIATTFPARYIIESTETTLKNLGTDYLDVQQLHTWAPSYIESDEWREAAAKLKDQGKILAFGISANDWDPYGSVELVQSGEVDSVQVIYNIFEQRPAEQLLPAALDSNTAVIVRVPFEEGFLTGKFRPGHRFAEGDWRADWMTEERLREVERRLEPLAAIAKGRDDTLAGLALRFCLAHPAVSTVIPGMRRALHVEENTAVSGGRPLDEAERQLLQDHAFVHGWAYPW